MNKIKKISIIVCCLLLILGTSALAANGTVYNTSQGLVFRKTASKTGEPIGTIYNDTVVEILGTEGEWYKVKHNDTEGYLFAEYVKVEETPTEVSTETPEEPTTETAAPVSEKIETIFPKEAKLLSNAKVYIMPVINSSVTNTINAETVVTVKKEVNNWSYITSGTISGWIRTFYLNNVLEVPAEPVQETPVDPAIEVPAFTKGYINVEAANLRKEASTSSEILTTLTLNTAVTVVSQTGEWYQVTYGDYSGYMSKELISETQTVTNRGNTEPRQVEETGYVSVRVANVRQSASTSSKILTTLNQKAEVKITGEEGTFYKINLNGGVAYISKSLIVNSLDEVKVYTVTQPTTTTNAAVTSNTGSTAGQNIVNFANQYLGYSYVWGGTTPSGGFDCSGFVYYIFNSCGYSLSRSCSVQANSGTAVTKEELQLGDVIFFNNGSGGSIGHVGIYIGNGRFIHAANPTRGVVTDTINSGYYNTYYYSARRIAN